MEDCIFCKIMNGEIPSKTIYEDDIVKVFLDINPDSDGHMLIVPKKHIVDFTSLDDDTLVHINHVVKNLKSLIYDRLNPDGIRLVNNYGCYQLVKHYHLHVIPCYEKERTSLSVDEVFDLLTK